MNENMTYKDNFIYILQWEYLHEFEYISSPSSSATHLSIVAE